MTAQLLGGGKLIVSPGLDWLITLMLSDNHLNNSEKRVPFSRNGSVPVISLNSVRSTSPTPTANIATFLPATEACNRDFAASSTCLASPSGSPSVIRKSQGR